ncbi:MAG TPA: metallophosphoesterase [Bacteroidota bacterium]|nr:metallophosphoesterase [Bacteroidota bacterium]
MNAQIPSTIIDPLTKGYTAQREKRIYAVSVDQLKPSVLFTADTNGLRFDLHDSTLYGRIHYGPADFDYVNSDYLEPRFRSRSEVKKGKGLLEISSYFKEESRSNVNHWSTSGAIGFRFELLRVSHGVPMTLGMYDGRVDFKKTPAGYSCPLTITEGPIVGCIQSDHPNRMTIAFETDRPSTGQIEVKELGVYADPAEGTRHEITIDKLSHSHLYHYRAIAINQTDSVVTPWMIVRSAPPKGKGRVVFAYSGDSRATTGGGENEYIGVNRTTITQIAKQVYRKGASFFLFGGDLIGGYTSSQEDFTLMLKAFKTTFSGFLHSVPVYNAIGNHEAHYFGYTDAEGKLVEMDKYPYDSVSAEAIFARELIQPSNGPAAYDGMPSYARTVYSLQYGPVKTLVLNTNYWNTSDRAVPELGGSPEGYILPNQVEWIERELTKAERDPTVKYIVVLAHEPFFPNGGHASDAMWYEGDNTVRSWRSVNGVMTPFESGVIDVRNHLWELFSNSKKVAVVLGSDEHNYHRSLITRTTPVGVMSVDDLNRDGILNDGKISPNPKFTYPTWFMVCGGAGAPYYTQEPTPWSAAVKKFTAQNNYFIFTADEQRIGLEVFNANGQLLDSITNLLDVKRKK